MTIDEAIKIKEHNRHWGILCPTPEDFEADDLSIEALKRVSDMRISPCTTADEILPRETED